MQFDIIIVGGGMVGAATACALQHRSLKIALIDATVLDAAEDHRLIALNYNSIQFFKNLNRWDALAPYATAIKSIHVSHRGHFGVTRLHDADVNLPFLGQVIPAKHINQSLYQQLDNITLIRPARLTHLQQEEDHVRITIKTGLEEKKLLAKIIIAADGTQSTTRDLANITATVTDYHQSALVTTTELSRTHHQVAYERFQSNGAIAMLPLFKHRVATIWTANTERISELLQLNDAEFLKELQHQFGYRLGKLNAISQRYSYPLRMVKAAQKIKHRVLLLGNAAHTLHPIAAQGLNLALFEVVTIADYLSHHDKLSLLEEFAEQQQTISMRLSHHLSWLFSYDFFPIRAARKIGLVGLDVCQPLKKYFIRQIIAHSSALPPLLREQEAHEIQSI